MLDGVAAGGAAVGIRRATAAGTGAAARVGSARCAQPVADGPWTVFWCVPYLNLCYLFVFTYLLLQHAHMRTYLCAFAHVAILASWC
jgi:hypothetical protein